MFKVRPCCEEALRLFSIRALECMYEPKSRKAMVYCKGVFGEFQLKYCPNCGKRFKGADDELEKAVDEIGGLVR